MFFITTLFILPGLMALFGLVEMRVRREVIGKYFNYLEKPIGKGFYLIMVGLMLTDVGAITEAIFCIIISLVGLFNIAVGIVYESLDFDPNEEEIIEVQRVPVTSSN